MCVEGVTVVGRLIRKTGRVSIIVLLLSVLIIVGYVPPPDVTLPFPAQG